MSEKVKISIQNLEAAWSQLDEYLKEPIINNRDRSGIIKAFEFTFELTWKTFQKISQDEGLETGGPKSALKTAFKLNLIKNDEEPLWLQMLEDRNLMSHTYRESLSKIVTEKIQQHYYQAFKNVLERLKERYK